MFVCLPVEIYPCCLPCVSFHPSVASTRSSPVSSWASYDDELQPVKGGRRAKALWPSHNNYVELSCVSGPRRLPDCGKRCARRGRAWGRSSILLPFKTIREVSMHQWLYSDFVKDLWPLFNWRYSKVLCIFITPLVTTQRKWNGVLIFFFLDEDYYIMMFRIK